MSKNNDANNIQDLLNHIRICALDIVNRSKISRNNLNDYSIRHKSWSISLFIITAGFCVKEKCSIDFIYYFLPFIPIFLFWFLHFYNVFTNERYINSLHLNKFDEILNERERIKQETLKRRRMKNLNNYEMERICN